jgi:hypothetical protein
MLLEMTEGCDNHDGKTRFTCEKKMKFESNDSLDNNLLATPDSFYQYLCC